MRKAAPARLVPRFRVLAGERNLLGPGKADLLAAIDEHGSLAAAARALGMSYMRAWSLLQEVNACFQAPLVAVQRGGPAHGGAALTPSRKVLRLYREIEDTALRAAAARWQQLRRLLHD
jgi:molybdate transport system regulatory protein